MRENAGFVVAVIACGVAVLAASKLVGVIRVVDVMTLFGAGFAAGAGLMGAIIRRRQRRDSAT
jgi:hypothetical protein